MDFTGWFWIRRRVCFRRNSASADGGHGAGMGITMTAFYVVLPLTLAMSFKWHGLKWLEVCLLVCVCSAFSPEIGQERGWIPWAREWYLLFLSDKLVVYSKLYEVGRWARSCGGKWGSGGLPPGHLIIPITHFNIYYWIIFYFYSLSLFVLSLMNENKV